MVVVLVAGWLSLLVHPLVAQTLDDGDGGEGRVEIVVEKLRDVVLVPENLVKVVEGTEHGITWYSTLPQLTSVSATVEDKFVAEVIEVGEVMQGTPNDNFTYYGHINISALFIGYNKVYVTLYDEPDVVAGEAVLDMSVLLSYQYINSLYTNLLGVLVTIIYVFMGATIDLKIISGIVKKPLGPMVGLFCQYVFMPLIAFGLGNVAFPDNYLAQLGLFVLGCCPGGGASNMWTHLLGGSLDLSIVMTFFSTLVAFGAIPLWVYLLGEMIVKGADFVIPYKNIAVLVVSLSIPCIIGLLIQRFLPKVSKVMMKLLTPVTLFSVIFIFTFGVYANLYVFSLFDTKSVLAGFALPTLGYLSGLILATLLRLPLKDRIAVCVETGIQNASVAVFILKFTLEKPAGDLTVVFPAAAVVMTPIPLAVALITRRIYLCIQSRKSQTKEEDGGKEGVEKKPDEQKTETAGTDNPALDMKTEDGNTEIIEGRDNPALDMREEAV
ncbi:hypothetical protein Pcinc_003216 [Petrolisthes cinctipes]|uniref:Uncharacterized protein n=1 Tax=Petrolisthes cinctipes TaxID=88211 RepID=A0AAE1GGR0_PETCI|nr:hypothetical protein Pcinc_003216 [Petrolisthes cinctipes]